MNPEKAQTPTIEIRFPASNPNCARVWIDLSDAEAAQSIAESLFEQFPDCPMDKFRIVDWQNCPGLQLSDFDTWEKIRKAGPMYAWNGTPFLQYMRLCKDVDHAVATYQDAYLGTWEDEEDFAVCYIAERTDTKVVDFLDGFLEWRKLGDAILVDCEVVYDGDAITVFKM